MRTLARAALCKPQGPPNTGHVFGKMGRANGQENKMAPKKGWKRISNPQGTKFCFFRRRQRHLATMRTESYPKLVLSDSILWKRCSANDLRLAFCTDAAVDTSTKNDATAVQLKARTVDSNCELCGLHVIRQPAACSM